MTGSLVTPRIETDLAEIADRSEPLFRLVANSDVVITGATGFVGKWLTLSYLYSQRRFGLDGRVHLVARDLSAFSASLDRAGFKSRYSTIEVDVRQIDPNSTPDDAWIIHAATPAQASLNTKNPMEMLGIIIDGQRSIMEVATRRGAKKVLFTSSGAVYGKLPLDLPCVHESWSGAPSVSDPLNAYHEGKRTAELIGNVFASHGELEFVSARLFAFLAPFLPIDQHFAAGNFLRDAHEPKRITISSGGGSVRSYQYGTDLAVWLWTILLQGRNQAAYNVGSGESITIRQLAETISSESTHKPSVQVLGTDTERSLSRYVPDVTLAGTELGLSNHVSLAESIRRTLQWMDER